MRILIIVFCTLLLSPLTITAQSSIQSDAGKQFYVFVAPTLVNRDLGRAYSLALGAGVEDLLGEHVFLGGELAESIISSSLRNPQTNNLREQAGHVLWLALNGGYQFRRRDDARPFKPFVTAGCGISGVHDAGLGTQINYGAGFNRWHSEHLGVRVELRRFIHSGDSERRFIALRVGLAIR